MTSSCKGDKPRKCLPPQKVVIPKGMINPDETTVIEIPARLHKQPIVIAKRKCCNSLEPCGTLVTDCKDMTGLGNHEHNESDFDPIFHSTGVSQPMPCGCPSHNCSTNATLGETEAQERMELQHDLEEFQKARRKLLASASKLASQEPPGNGTLSSSFDSNCSKRKHKSKLHPDFNKEEYSRQLYDTLLD